MSIIHCPHCTTMLIFGEYELDQPVGCPSCSRLIPTDSPTPTDEQVEQYLRARCKVKAIAETQPPGPKREDW